MHLALRSRQGKDSDVFINGELQTHEKVNKETARHRPSVAQQMFTGSSLPFYS